jgi:hypothetical protein
MPVVSMPLAHGFHPFEAVLYVIEIMIDLHGEICISGMRPDFAYRRISHGRNQFVVFFSGYRERLPGCARAHSTRTATVREYLIHNVIRRKDSARVEALNIINECQQKTCVRSGSPWNSCRTYCTFRSVVICSLRRCSITAYGYGAIE